MRKLPLDGVRVTDFCWIGAGSYTTKLLSDLGADVLKIESSTRLDSIRMSGPFKDKQPGVNRSGYFADRNTSKRSVTINLKEQRGVELVKRLITQSEIVTNNFTPGTMDKLGLGYDVVRAIRPDVIYVGMSMQGESGPDRDTMGYGLTIGAMTGVQYLTGLPGREPAGTGTNYPDHIPNPGHAAFAILAALRHKRRTGEGQRIDIAQTEAMIALLAPAIMDYAVNGRLAEPRGNQHVAAAPHGVYPCHGEDRWIAIAATDDARWIALAEVLKLEARSDWTSGAARYRDRQAVDEAVAAATRSWIAEELMDVLQRRGVPAGVVQNSADLVDRDPQLAHRGHWFRLDHPEMGKTIYTAPPFRFASMPVGPRFAAPLLGQHTEEVCRELLGLESDEISALVEEGVLA